eukprot:g5877.t2
MAEGRWLPWKEQKVDIRPTPDYKELAKPLKKPPHGLEWRRLEDGAWELRQMRKALSVLKQEGQEEDRTLAEDEQKETEEGLGEEEDRAPEFLEHVVMPDDTLLGICLKYKVKDRELRRLNGFVGSHFRMCDVLIIPNTFAAGQQPVQRAIGKQPMTRDDMMQIFRKASQLGAQEARFYLEASAWDLAKALAEWREENRWEAEQNVDMPNRPEAVRRQQQQLRQLRPQVTTGTGAKTSGSINTASARNDGDTADDGDDPLAEARVPLLANSFTSSLPGVSLL